MLQAEVSVDNEAFYLVELSQMGVIKGFIAEDTIDGKKLTRPERFFLSNHLKVP